MAVKKNENGISIEPIKETILKITLVGEGDLILNKKARSYEMAEVYKQSHPRGTEMPPELNQEYNLWEKLITSITWEKSIEFHDSDYSQYTEEEWKNIVSNNRPCIHAIAFQNSFLEAFKTFGFKESTQKNGTDLKRALNMTKQIYPVDITSASYEQKLVQSKALGNPNVLAQYNVFHGWSCDIVVSVPNKVFPIETVLSIIDTAGRYIGIGSQRSNSYGRYHVGAVQEIKNVN